MECVMVSAITKRNPVAILVALALAAFIISVDVTIVNVALPTLVRRLGASTSELQWVVDAYSLVFAALVLTAGSLSDRLVSRKAEAPINLG
jgi:MFS family permease